MIDSHVHLDAAPYSENDGVSEILKAANRAGVNRFVAPALHLDSYTALRRLQGEFPEITPAAGVHPHEVNDERLENLAERLTTALEDSNNPIVGETGLEGHYDFVPMNLQIESLRAHLAVARDLSAPIILHCRNCESLLYEELKERPPLAGGVVHCFTGTWEWAQRFLELGLHIGITGIVTFKKADQVVEVASKVPLSRLLVETDGPYLAPMPYRGKLNKPEYIPLIVDKIAELRQVERALIAESTSENAQNLFKLERC